MGQVIAITDITRGAVSEPGFNFVEESYRRLAALPGFIVRAEQKDLSHAICTSLTTGVPLAAEAPTGTGKTLAYLIGAIAARQKNRAIESPIVVATATVGLQSQILLGDLPKLVEAGIVDSGAAVLAKGRSRYFCIKSAERYLDGKDVTPQTDFFNQEKNEEAIEAAEIEELMATWNSHGWSGDIDSYPKSVGPSWKQVAASTDTCINQKCSHYNGCPFFNARRTLSTAKIIVANHDLVLADLAMVKEGQEPLFPGKNYLVVFDEAHHLPDKAMEAGSASLQLTTLLEELPRTVKFAKGIAKHGELSRLVEKKGLRVSDFDASGLIENLKELALLSETLAGMSENGTHRFPLGKMNQQFVLPLGHAVTQCDSLIKAMQDATQELKQTDLAEKNPSIGNVIAELLHQATGLNSLLGSLDKALYLLTTNRRAVRWAELRDERVNLCTSPIEGADVLRELLWKNERVKCAMVSATIQDFEGFDRFRTRLGAPEEMTTMTLPHIFPYDECRLYLVNMDHSPKQAQKDGFQRELSDVMPKFIDSEEGTLVLFPSRALMKAMLPRLKAVFGEQVIAQGEKGVKELVALHKRKIDEGKGSILCGLATMAEGLDLPGKYCTHVAICALPFTAPVTPVEMELQEIMGAQYFYKRSLPDTLVKMVQMVGRLMRRESDRGRITVFDNRLHKTVWGQKLLASLPNFQQVIVDPRDPPTKKVALKLAAAT